MTSSMCEERLRQVEDGGNTTWMRSTNMDGFVAAALPGRRLNGWWKEYAYAAE
jgi:hypothetical protein